MKTETIPLYTEGEFEASDKVFLTTYISNDKPDLKMPPRPAMLVIPGGAYAEIAHREAEPIAKAYFAKGFQVFVLEYSVKPYAVFPRPLTEVSRAIVHIRSNAERYNVNPERVFAAGFSAGGHLAASIGTFWMEDCAKATDDMPFGRNRPTGIVLGYPVITFGDHTHRGTMLNALGTKAPTQEQLDSLSLEKHVTQYSAPVYIWHSAEDNAVPVQNSLLFAYALTQNHVPMELRIFPYGPHGLALSTKETWSQNPAWLRPEAAQWLDESCDFMMHLPDASEQPAPICQ